MGFRGLSCLRVGQQIKVHAILIGVEDPRLAMAVDGLLKGFNAEVGRQVRRLIRPPAPNDLFDGERTLLRERGQGQPGFTSGVSQRPLIFLGGKCVDLGF